jgi:hypothetical protein
MVAGERARHVLGGLAGAEAHLLLLDIDGMAAELDGGDLHRASGAGRRLLEQQGDALSGERQAEVGKLGQGEDLLQPLAPEIGDREDPGHQLLSRLTMVPM